MLLRPLSPVKFVNSVFMTVRHDKLPHSNGYINQIFVSFTLKELQSTKKQN